MNRAEAALAGLSKYAGNPCPKGHTERWTLSGGCVACQAAWLAQNRAKLSKQIKSKGD